MIFRRRSLLSQIDRRIDLNVSLHCISKLNLSVSEVERLGSNVLLSILHAYNRSQHRHRAFAR